MRMGPSFMRVTVKLTPSRFRFIRQSLAACLVLFGCDRNRLIELGMIIDDETRGLPPKYDVSSHASLLFTSPFQEKNQFSTFVLSRPHFC